MRPQGFYPPATLQPGRLQAAVAGKLVIIIHQLLTAEANHFGVVSDITTHESGLRQVIKGALLNGPDITLGNLEMICHLSQ